MRILLLSFLLGGLAACTSAPASSSAPLDFSVSADVASDPSQTHVLLPGAAEGWQASLVLDRGEIGIWTVKSLPFFTQYVADEIIGLDDAGRCWVLVNYSGKWTRFPVLEDGKWLGALAQGEADPRVEGAEVYVGGAVGRVFQLRAYPDGSLDARRIAAFPGKEVHTLVAGEFDPRNDSPEVLVFTSPGAWYQLTPTGAHGEWEAQDLGPLPSRVRDALVLSSSAGGSDTLVLAGRDGSIRSLRIDDQGPHWELVHQAGQGRGRLAQDPNAAATVLYSTADDGQIFRHERGAEGWRSERIRTTSVGPRGLAAGRFHPDPNRECVVSFGYSGRVELHSRPPGGAWETELLFVDRDKGHWLCAGEYDARNDTLELFTAGYGGRIVMLARERAED